MHVFSVLRRRAPCDRDRRADAALRTRSFGGTAARSIALGLTLLTAVAAGDDAASPPPFQPSDISIGEPIPLPGRGDAAPTAVPPGAGRSPDDGAAVRAIDAGKGWLGMAVGPAPEPGRWAVAEVAGGGPAALAGIRVGDEVRAIDGTQPRSLDLVAESLAALAPGQQVRLAIARGGQVTDVMVRATPRPAPGTAPAWRDAPAQPAPLTEIRPPAAGSTPLPSVSVLAAGEPVAANPWATPAAPPARVAPPPAVAVAPSQGRVPPARVDVLPDPLPDPPAAAGRGRTALGVRTVPIDAGVQARFRLPEAGGAYVIAVVHDLPASRAGVPPGSVIVAIDDRPVRSPEELTRLVTGGPVGRAVPLRYVLPGGEEKQAEVVLQPLELPLERALVSPAAPLPTPPPALEAGPGPRSARRPPPTDEAETLRDEIARLRARIDALERRLAAPGG